MPRDPTTTKRVRNEAERREKEALAARRKAALTILGDPRAGGQREMVYASTAARLLRITPAALRKLAEPDEFVDNPRYRSGPPAALYDPLVLIRLSESAEVGEARTRRGAKHPRDYVPTFVKRFGTPANAVARAAEIMFSLNRYAKHRRCVESHRAEIYLLKNRLLQRLTELGHLARYGVHEVVKPARSEQCWGCDGEGCGRCDFTGFWRDLPERRLRFYVLMFQIGGKPYTWHSPERDLTWALPGTPTPVPTDWIPADREKPVMLPARRFAEAKALIRWVAQGG